MLQRVYTLLVVVTLVAIGLVSTAMGVAAVDSNLILVKEWTFDGNTSGWGQVNNLAKPSVNNGSLSVGVTGFDPYLHSPVMKLDGNVAKHIKIRMRNTVGSQLKIYWRTSAEPAFSEGMSQTIGIKKDGDMHEYEFYVDHPKWSGQVQQIRFDLEPADCGKGDWEIDSVAVYRRGPQVSAEIGESRKAIVEPNQELTYNITVANTGGEPLSDVRTHVSLPMMAEVHSGDLDKGADSLMPGDRMQWTVKAKALTTGIGDIQVAVTSGQAATAVKSSLVVTKKALSTDAAIFSPGFHRLNDGASISNGMVCLRFVDAGFGITHMSMFWKDSSGKWVEVAASSPLGSLAFSSTAEAGIVQMPLTPQAVLSNADSSVILAGSFVDSESGRWKYQMTYALSGSRVIVSHEISCDTDRYIWRWSGPGMQAGEGSFGSTKSDALYPGLEWLVKDESSSSSLDIAPPQNLRWAPDPLKVTVPAMAVSDGTVAVGMVWNPDQKWDGKSTMPLSRFSSPNWVQGQDNHMMLLSVPSIPEYLPENTDLARKPYLLAGSKKLTLDASFFAKASKTALIGVDEWLETYGLPKLQSLPRSYTSQVSLSRDAYLSALWKDGKGWSHCIGWDAAPSPAFAHLLLLDTLNTKGLDQKTKAEMDKRINWTIDQVGLAGLASGAGSHLYGWELPFFVGGVAESLESLRGTVKGLISSQLPDGSWDFNPSTPEQATLGHQGAVESGLILNPASSLMRWARITGDQEALDAGLAALKKAREYRVPRAAQVWECPVHSPDILSSAKGVQAYLDAYIATGEKSYMTDALYWAKSGLPFVYMWGKDDLPVMDFSSIPIYGATFYTLSWLGRPVQWNGLVYAYWLFQLARYDKSFPWSQIAEGITRSGMWQTVAEGANKGTYPDSWSLDSDSPNGPYLNPEDVVKNVWVLLGNNPEIRTRVINSSLALESTGKRIHISSPADITATSVKNGVVEAQVSHTAKRTTYCLLTGIPKPLGATFGGRTLKEGLDWTYDVLNNWMVVKLTHSGKDSLRVRIAK